MKKLTLKKEILAELTTDQLRAVAGGAGDSNYCTSEQCSCDKVSCNDIDLTAAYTAVSKFLLVDC